MADWAGFQAVCIGSEKLLGREAGGISVPQRTSSGPGGAGKIDGILDPFIIGADARGPAFC